MTGVGVGVVAGEAVGVGIGVCVCTAASVDGTFAGLAAFVGCAIGNGSGAEAETAGVAAGTAGTSIDAAGATTDVAAAAAGVAVIAGDLTIAGVFAVLPEAVEAFDAVVELVITSPEPGRAVDVTEPTGTGAVLISVLT